MALVVSIVAVWLTLAVVLGVTIGRAIRRADEAELGRPRQVDAGRLAPLRSPSDVDSVPARARRAGAAARPQCSLGTARPARANLCGARRRSSMRMHVAERPLGRPGSLHEYH